MSTQLTEAEKQYYQDRIDFAVSGWQIPAKLSRLPLWTKDKARFGLMEETEDNRAAIETLLSMCRGKMDSPFVLLYGLPGRGKTWLAWAAGWYVILINRKQSCYWRAAELLDALKNSFHIHALPGEVGVPTYDSIMNYCKKVQLLILDDLGVGAGTDWSSGILDEIVDARYSHKLATIITSNTLEIPDRILSRCREGAVIWLRGKDYRAKEACQNASS